MTNADVPAPVLEFILRRIDSVAELETLLIVSADASRAWSVDEIATRIYSTSAAAAAVLRALQAHRLVSSSDDGTRFRFSPASEEERQVVAQTANAYRTHLIPIATLIHKKTSGAVQEFARAFSLKKDS